MTETLDSRAMTAQGLVAAWPILDREERQEAFDGLDAEHADEFFQMLDAADQAELLAGLNAARRKHCLSLLPPDDLTDVFQEVDERARRDVFRSLTPEALAEVQALASYDWDDAGGIMTPDFAHLTPDMTADQGIVALRLQLREQPETLRYIYVLEKSRRLVGVVSLRALFGAPPGTPVRSLMKTDLVTVREDTDQEEVAQQMRDHGLVAIPVVDAERRMKGIITSDDVIEVMEEEATEDIQKLAAVEPTEIEYARASVWLLWRRRVTWLVVLLLGGFLTAMVIEQYERTLETAVVLAFYVPLLIGTGGNSGTQTAMLVIRSLATGELRARDWWRVVVKELLVALLLGALLALLLASWALFSDHGGGRLALILAISIVVVVLWANLVGAVLPILLRALKLDPAVVSAPLIATLVDATGIFLYFTIAIVLLGR